MHPEAYDFVAGCAQALDTDGLSVLEIGGRNVNGGIRDLFHGARWTALDVVDGEGVDIVADAATWNPQTHPGWPWDVVVSCETLEHARRWPAVVNTIALAVRPGGTVIVTAACDPRPPHSGIDGWALRDGEWYENVHPPSLLRVAESVGLTGSITTHPRGDVYLTARTPVDATADQHPTA